MEEQAIRERPSIVCIDPDRACIPDTRMARRENGALDLDHGQ